MNEFTETVCELVVLSAFLGTIALWSALLGGMI